MKTKLGLLLSVLTLSTVAVPAAHAGVGILGGVGFNNTTSGDGVPNPNINRDTKGGFVGGLAFSSNFMLLNLELDGLYNYRTRSLGGQSFSSPAIEVPLLVRFSILPSILDIGVGPYGSFNVGSNDLGYQGPDWGAVGSVRVTIPTPGIHLVIDGRYNFGFTNISPLGDLYTQHTREVQVMAGIDVPFFGGSDDHSSNTSN